METSWKVCSLADIGTIVTGKTPATKNKSFWNGNIMFITPGDLQNTKHLFRTERYITKMGLNAVKGSILPKGSICVSSIGNLGYVGMTTVECVSNQQINSIIPNKNMDADFIYYLMKSKWRYFKSLEGQSTALSILNKTQFSKIEVTIPHLQVQKKIASILSCIDDKIEMNNKINANLEEQAQAIYKSWFIDLEPYCGTIPSDWKIGVLSDIADVLSGKRPAIRVDNADENNDIPLVGATSIMGYTNNYNFNEKILVTGRVGTHGVVQRLKTPCWASDNTLIIKTKFYEYTWLVLKGINYSSMNRGSTQPLITQSDLKKVEIIIPSELVLTDFEDTVCKLMDKYEFNIEENKNLAELRDTLLPKLMSGEIDVEDLDL